MHCGHLFIEFTTLTTWCMQFIKNKLNKIQTSSSNVITSNGLTNDDFFKFIQIPIWKLRHLKQQQQYTIKVIIRFAEEWAWVQNLTLFMLIHENTDLFDICGMKNPDARVDEFCHNDDKLKCVFFSSNWNDLSNYTMLSYWWRDFMCMMHIRQKFGKFCRCFYVENVLFVQFVFKFDKLSVECILNNK